MERVSDTLSESLCESRSDVWSRLETVQTLFITSMGLA